MRHYSTNPLMNSLPGSNIQYSVTIYIHSIRKRLDSLWQTEYRSCLVAPTIIILMTLEAPTIIILTTLVVSIFAPTEDYRRKLIVAYDRKNIFLSQAIGVGLDP